MQAKRGARLRLTSRRPSKSTRSHQAWLLATRRSRLLRLGVRHVSSGGLTLFKPGTSAQGIAGVFMSMVGIKLYNYYRPFLDPTDDILGETVGTALDSKLVMERGP